MGEKVVVMRPVSTTSSQLSISDRMTDEDESLKWTNVVAQQASSSSTSSLNAPLRGGGKGVVPRTTTISTIAMESNTSPPPTNASPTRLVIALLQTPERGLQLKVIELTPGLLRLPDNLADAEDFLKNHNQVIKNLQNKQSPVEELLRQADHLIATQKPRAEVYAAMAHSLGLTWKDLNGILDERKRILELVYLAHKSISDCLVKIEEVHVEYSSKLNILRISEEDVSTSLNNLKRDRREVLRKVGGALETCDQLLIKIAQFNYSIDSRDLVLVKDVEFANRQVGRWLERLHDRRVILEDKLKNKKEQFEEFVICTDFAKQLSQLEEELANLAKLSTQIDFGWDPTSAEARKTDISLLIVKLQEVQDKSLQMARKFEERELVGEGRGKFYQKECLKTKIFELLGQTNDLLTESLDLDLSIKQAHDFFILAQQTEDKLGEYSGEGIRNVDALTYDALSKGEILLDLHGWESHRTKGVRKVHDSLLQSKEALLEEIEHLKVLDEYNHFLDSLNQGYERMLRLEKEVIREPMTLPLQTAQVKEFILREKGSVEGVEVVDLPGLVGKLEGIYPGLSEEDKYAAEIKINQLKSISNNVVEVLMERVSLGREWLQILELYNIHKQSSNFSINSSIKRHEVQRLFDHINTQRPGLHTKFNEIRISDPDLSTEKVEERLDEMLAELRTILDTSLLHEKIKQICQKYKVKLDEHLLGDSSCSSSVGSVDSSIPSSSKLLQLSKYYPVLAEVEVATILRQSTTQLSATLTEIIQHKVETKLEDALSNFFPQLLSSYQEDLVQVKGEGSPEGKTQEEVELEGYCDRLRESYIRVSTELKGYLGDLLTLCSQVEGKVREVEVKELESEEAVTREIDLWKHFKDQVGISILERINPRLQHLLLLIEHEEPPIEAHKEARVVHLMTSYITKEGLEGSFQSTLTFLTQQLTQQFIMTDLNLISGQLNELIQELDQPCNYGDNLIDARANLNSFDRFQNTVQLLNDKLNGLLGSAGIPKTDDKYQSLQASLDQLSDKMGKRKEYILLSLEYFQLIEKSEDYYNEVSRELESIQGKSKEPELKIEIIEDLLRKVIGMKGKEGNQETRLEEIERIAKILFVDSGRDEDPTGHQPTSLEPLREKQSLLSQHLHKVESDLTELLRLIKSPSEVEEQRLEVGITKVIQQIGHSTICTQTAQQPNETTLEIMPMNRLSVLETIRRSMSPLTLEKETQFEEGEKAPPEEKVERDTLTQTIDERSYSIQTQTQTETFMEEGLRLTSVKDTTGHPTFIQPLKDLWVNEGDRVVLECRTRGCVGGISWYKDGMDVKDNADYKVEFVEDGIARMEVEEVFMEDSALYTCRAVGVGNHKDVTIETTGKLSVKESMTTLMQPPKFWPHDPILNIFEGKNEGIELRVDGNPLPTVQWFRNGQCIDTNPDYIITFNNGCCQVQIDHVVKTRDEGNYLCNATNKVGSAETTVSLRVEKLPVKKDKEKPVIVRALPVNAMTRAGQKLKLEFEFESPTASQILWYKDGSKLSSKFSSSSMEIQRSDRTGSLMFNEAYSADSGTYVACIRNPHGECETKCHVVVKGLLPIETSDSELNASDMEILKPIVKMELKDVEGEVGDCVRLDCVIVGHPEPEVIWYRNNTPLKESPNHCLLYQGDKCSLIIRKLDPEDAGSYVVTAVNSGGEGVSKCNVKVHEPCEVIQEVGFDISNPPRFEKILQDDMVMEGMPYTFSVELASDSNPLTPTCVTWWKNNERIESDEVYEILTEGETHSLKIRSCRLQDRGSHMAKAKNTVGEIKCFGSLIVKEKSGVVAKKNEEVLAKEIPKMEIPRKLSIPKVSNRVPRFFVPLEGRMVNEGESVIFRCVVDAHPVPEIKWIKNNSVEPVKMDSNFRQMYEEKSGDVELVINKVGIRDGGQYSCVASNSEGTASTVADLVVKKINFPPVFSKRLQCLTIEEGKRLYLEVDVYSKPEPNVTWEHDGVKLDESSTGSDYIFQSDSSTRYSIALPAASASLHGGEYTVKAKNEVGEALSSCTVTITQLKVKPPSPLVFSSESTQLPVVSTAISPNERVVVSTTAGRMGNSLECLETAQPGVNVITETVRITKMESSFQSITSSMNLPGPSAGELEVERKSPPTLVVLANQFIDSILLEPGPEPEILVAPSPTFKNKGQNQVQEKVKTFQEQIELQADSPDPIPPTGGVRIIPIREFQRPVLVGDISRSNIINSPAAAPPGQSFYVPRRSSTPEQLWATATPTEDIKRTTVYRDEPLPAQPPAFGDKPQFFCMPPQSSEQKLSSSTSTSGVIKSDSVMMREQYSFNKNTSEVKAIKPSKFVPEKMRESDYESDFETSYIPPKWKPSSAIPSGSAFVPVSTGKPAYTPQITTSSSSEQTESFCSRTVEYKKPVVPPKPGTIFPPPGSSSPRPQGVKGLIKSWPPVLLESLETSSAVSAAYQSGEEREESRFLKPTSPAPLFANQLSPVSIQVTERSRSPTPNREALEMDKLWSKPLRFSSPTKCPVSPLTVPKKPEVPPKPQRPGAASPRPFTPVSSPISPAVIPQQEGESSIQFRPLVPPKPVTKSRKEADPIYYVSRVSTPRTTPIPPCLSPPPGLYGTFSEMEQVFEQSSTSYSSQQETSSSSYNSTSQIQTSALNLNPYNNPESARGDSAAVNFQIGVELGGLGGFPLLQSSMRPPPDLPFMFSSQYLSQDFVQTGFLHPQTQSSSIPMPLLPRPGATATTTSSQMNRSSSSSRRSTIVSSSGPQGTSLEEVGSCRPTGPVTSLTSKSTLFPSSIPVSRDLLNGEGISRRSGSSNPLVSYRKPSKFMPQLDFGSSVEKDYSSSEWKEPLKPEWTPEGREGVRLTTWKRVDYQPIPPKIRRNSLASFMDAKMQDINVQFKGNIGQMSQGLCYNRMDRKVESELGPSNTGEDGGGGGGDLRVSVLKDESKKEGGGGRVDADPLIYFKYDFAYEFGIADPLTVVVRASSEPANHPAQTLDTHSLHIPIIHEKSSTKN